jgi:DNA-binding PadR family transcriptional regulator
VLRKAGLLEVRLVGRGHLYHLRPEGFAELREWLIALEQFRRERAAVGDDVATPVMVR